MKYQFLIYNRVVFRTAAVSFAKGTVSQKNEFKINSYVHSSRNHWKCKYYIFHGLTSLLTVPTIKFHYSLTLKRKTKETAVHYFSSVLRNIPYTVPTNICTLKYSPMCYKLSVFSIVELFLGSCLYDIIVE